MSPSTIKQQLNKQEGVFSEGLDEGSVERCQMTTADFDESHVLMNAWLCKQTRSVQQHTAASSFSLPLLLLALLSRCRYGSRAERRLRCCPKDPGWIMETTSGSNHSGPERCYETETYMFKLFLLLFFYTLLWHFFFFLYLFSPSLFKLTVFHFNCSLFQCIHVKSSCGPAMKAILLNLSVDVIAFFKNPINTGCFLIPSLCGEPPQLCSEASICSAANSLDGS